MALCNNSVTMICWQNGFLNALWQVQSGNRGCV